MSINSLLRAGIKVISSSSMEKNQGLNFQRRKGKSKAPYLQKNPRTRILENLEEANKSPLQDFFKKKKISIFKRSIFSRRRRIPAFQYFFEKATKVFFFLLLPRGRPDSPWFCSMLRSQLAKEFKFAYIYIYLLHFRMHMESHVYLHFLVDGSLLFLRPQEGE